MAYKRKGSFAFTHVSNDLHLPLTMYMYNYAHKSIAGIYMQVRLYNQICLHKYFYIYENYLLMSKLAVVANHLLT